MKQYLELLKEIKEKGTYKPAAREGMPGTQSLFGYQFRHNLADGFPLLTTKEIFWKGVVVELLWFLKGDTNIKYLVDNGVNIWNEDAYNYYLKKCKEQNLSRTISLELFVSYIKNSKSITELEYDSFKNVEKDNIHALIPKNYKLGDCGFQYGRVWRAWNGEGFMEIDLGSTIGKKLGTPVLIDQIKNLINSLKNTPGSRRHIVTAIDPAHDQDLALYWCHAMFQFNCRPIPWEEKLQLAMKNPNVEMENLAITEAAAGNKRFGIVPQYYLDCQLYQRSADVVLGVPFNIASYALLTHILAKMCNMIPGEFIHTFGDVHIYDNHKEAVEEQLKRTPTKLPNLKLNNGFVVEFDNVWNSDLDIFLQDLIQGDWRNIIQLENYTPQGKIKAELSTGLK